MRLNVINSPVLLRNRRRIIVNALLFLCSVLLTACADTSSDPNGYLSNAGGVFAADGDDVASVGNEIAAGGHGPTMFMSYRKEEVVENPITSFMYFVPLIALTQVDNISSVNNDQQVGIISHQVKEDSKSFQVICEFEILGSGFHMNTFDPAGMIASHTDELKEGETLTNMLDYIRIEGDGYGIIEVTGQITDSVRTVTEVDLTFNTRGHKSPVTIGLYDIKPKDGKYQYENRSNEIVARVNTLAFQKAEGTPRMGIKIASIARINESAGFSGWIKGAIANMLIKPLKVDPLGNTTMLEFGEALFQKKPAFTFPKAKNIKEIKIAETDPVQM